MMVSIFFNLIISSFVERGSYLGLDCQNVHYLCKLKRILTDQMKTNEVRKTMFDLERPEWFNFFVLSKF